MNRRQRRCFAGRAPGLRLPIGHGPAVRLWTTSCGFEASEPIPFPGADSIFSSPCGAISGQARDRSGECRGRGAPAARFFPRFLSFQSFERRKISPLVHRRRIRQSPTKLVRRRCARRRGRLSVGTCGNARPWRFPGVAKGIRTTYHNFVFQKEKVRKSRRQPSRARSYRERGWNIHSRRGYRFRLYVYTSLCIKARPRNIVPCPW